MMTLKTNVLTALQLPCLICACLVCGPVGCDKAETPPTPVVDTPDEPAQADPVVAESTEPAGDPAPPRLTEEELAEMVPPPVVEIIRRALDGLGGEAALRGVHSFSLAGSIQSSMVGPGRIEMHFDNEGRYFEEREFFERNSLVRFGFDGQTPWMYYPIAHRVEETPRRYKSFTHTLLAGADEFKDSIGARYDNVDCWQLTDSQDVLWFFAMDSGLPIGQQLDARKGSWGVIRVRFEKWKEIAGVTIFTQMREHITPPEGLGVLPDSSLMKFTEQGINSASVDQFTVPEPVNMILADPERDMIGDSELPPKP